MRGQTGITNGFIGVYTFMQFNLRSEDVREAAYGWMLEYNQARPHDDSAISPPPNTVITSLEVLLLKCMLDGEAYA